MQRCRDVKMNSFFCVKKLVFVFLLVFTLICQPVLAFEFDTSVDDEIRKNYNPGKLEQDVGLPALPGTSDGVKNRNEYVQKPIKRKYKINLRTYARAQENPLFTSVVLKKGTKIPVRILNNISDKSRKGTRIKFVSSYPVSTTYFTIPAGTTFYGQIVNSHPPQFSANGGLIEINVTSVILNGEVHPINAYVTKANNKKIFLNNIKGKRRYLSSMVKSTKNGRHFFRKMMRVTVNLSTDGSSIVIAPFSLVAGVLTLGANIVASPALALFHKGGSVSINSGSEFVLKLNQDVFIYN